MKDEMPWPPQPNDLNPDNFNMPKKLGEFLTTLITGKDDGISSRHARLRHSLAQGIVYVVTEGRIKTPKSVLLPSIIKQLMNNTELINTIHRLGHGVSYSILTSKIINKRTSFCHWTVEKKPLQYMLLTTSTEKRKLYQVNYKF